MLEWIKTLMPLFIAIVAAGGIGHPIIAGINERKKIKLENDQANIKKAAILQKNQKIWDSLLKAFYDEFVMLLSTSGKDHILQKGSTKTSFIRFSELTHIFAAVKGKISLDYAQEYDLFEKTSNESIIFDQLDYFTQQREVK
jgi:hypothetical protein